MSMEKLGELIGKNLQDKERLKSQLINHGVDNRYFLSGRWFLRLRVTRFKVQSRAIGTAFILGHSSNAVLGTDALGAGTQGSWVDVEEVFTTQEMTNVGRIDTAKWLNSNADASSPDTAANPDYFAWGIDNTGFTVNSKIMGDEKWRAAYSVDSVSDGKAVLTAQIKSVNDAVAGQTVKELGLLTDGSKDGTITSDLHQTLNITLGTNA